MEHGDGSLASEAREPSPCFLLNSNIELFHFLYYNFKTIVFKME